MERITDKITTVMAKGVDASIRMYVRTYGRTCDIYYPKHTGIYSGSQSDVTYNEEPDDQLALFIPKLFNSLSRIPVMGNYDLLGTDDYYLIVPNTTKIPRLTKIVAQSQTLGISRFIIRDSDYASTFQGSVFLRIRLDPIYDTSQDSSIYDELRVQQVADSGAQIDNAIAQNNNKHGEYEYFLDKGGDSYHD